jgi:hypothetical protein
MKDITLCVCGKMTYVFLKNYNKDHSKNRCLVNYGIYTVTAQKLTRFNVSSNHC